MALAVTVRRFCAMTANSSVIGLAPTSEKTLARGFPAPWLGESLRNFFLGGVAGAVGAYFTYPINFVKMQLQYQKRTVGARGSPGVGSTSYTGAWDCVRKVVHSRGVQGLFQGVVPQILGVAPEKAIKLAVNDAIRASLSPLVRDIEHRTALAEARPGLSPSTAQLLVDVCAGACGGASQVIFTNVGEILMVRLALQREIASSMGATSVQPKGLLDVVRELGIRGLYTGSVPCLARDSIFAAIFFPLYYRLRDRLPAGLTRSSDGHSKNPSGQGADLASLESKAASELERAAAVPSKDAGPLPGSSLHLQNSLLAGIIAGSIAAGVTTPFDVVKTTMQAHRGTQSQVYRGMWDCVRHIYAEEGGTAFWKGFGPRMARSAPQFGITLLAYELLQLWWYRFLESGGTAPPDAQVIDLGEWAADSS